MENREEKKIKNELQKIDRIKVYQEEYSDKSFWDKIKDFAKVAGCEVVEKALILYYLAKDSTISTQDKIIIFSALGYFISPIDLIPDLTPLLGFSDDLAILIFIMQKLSHLIEDRHIEKAKEKLKEWC